MSKKKIRCFYCRKKNKWKRVLKEKGCKNCGLPVLSYIGRAFYSNGNGGGPGFRRNSKDKTRSIDPSYSRDPLLLGNGKKRMS